MRNKQAKARNMHSRGGPEFSTADLFDQQPDEVEVVTLQFQNFGQHRCFFGQVETVRVYDNHHPVGDVATSDGLGRVLVVDCAGTPSAGLMGDRIAALAIQNGWAGAVILGLIRDSKAIAELPFGIRAFGTTARRSSVQNGGERSVTIRLGGVNLSPGDWLYADHDAIIVSKRELEICSTADHALNYSLTS